MAIPTITTIDPAGFQGVGKPITVDGTGLDSASSISGLVGHWKLDEASGTTANDSSTNTNDGTLVNSPVREQGLIGRSLDFTTGNSEYVSLPDGIFNTLTSGTISAWFKAQASTLIPGQAGIFSSGDSAAASPYLKFAIFADNTFQVQVTGTSTKDVWITANTNWVDNEWTHIAWSSTGVAGEDVLYVNGVDAGKTISGFNDGGFLKAIADNATTTKYGIGRVERGSSTFGYMDGSIDDVRVYNTVLTATDIRSLYLNPGPRVYLDSTPAIASDATLEGYWKMNESASSSTVVDYSGNTYNGTPNGSLTKIRTDIGKGLSYNGTGYISIPSNTSFDFTDLSCSVWIKTSATTGVQNVLTRGDASNEPFFRCYLQSGVMNWYLQNGASTDLVTATTAINDGIWHHLVWTRVNGTSLKMYVDGVEDKSETVGIETFTLTGNNNALLIGSWDAQVPTDFYDGHMTELRVFSKSLSLIEVSNLYTQFTEAPITEYTNTSVTATIPESTTKGTDVIVENFDGNGNETYSVVNMPKLLHVDFTGGAAHQKEINEETDQYVFSKIESSGTTPSITIDQSVNDAFTVGSSAQITAAATPIDDAHAINKSYTDTEIDGASKITLVDGSSGTIVTGKAVAVNGSGAAILCDASTESTAQFIGVAATDASGTVDVYNSNVATTTGSFTEGQPIFSSTSAGGYVTTPPTALGEAVVRCGYAISANELFINPDFMGVNS